METLKVTKSKIAPNPKEYKYWIDLTADKNGKIMKVFSNGKWEKMSGNADDESKSDNYEKYNWERKTSFDLDVLKKAVADGNLEKYGLKVGDQTTINGHTYVIAGLNPMRGTTTPYCLTVNHVGLICIPHATTKWNASCNTSTGADDRGAGYANSDLHYYLTNTVLPLAETDLGADNILSHSCRFASAVNATGYNRFGTNSGCSSAANWIKGVKIAALSEMQVYGGTVWSSSGFDTGEACQQLEVFQKYKATAIFGTECIWLRDIASASIAAYANSLGDAYYRPASVAYYVAGLILFH